jgi:hypothetical protein
MDLTIMESINQYIPLLGTTGGLTGALAIYKIVTKMFKKFQMAKLFLQVDANKKNDALLVSDIQRNKEKYALLTDPEQKLATLAIITQQEEALNSKTGETFLNELIKETKIRDTAAQLGLTADKISDIITNKDEVITKLVNDTTETIKDGIDTIGDAASDVAKSFFEKREQANADGSIK